MRETAVLRQLLLPALFLFALFSPAACFSTARARRPALRRAARAPLVHCGAGGNEVDRELEVWRFREGVARGSYGALVNWREDGREEDEARSQRPERDSGEATKSAFIASATAVVVGALILRLGGRAALVSVLGLDVVADLGIGDQIDSVVGYVSALGPLSRLHCAKAIVRFSMATGSTGAWPVVPLWSMTSGSTVCCKLLLALGSAASQDSAQVHQTHPQSRALDSISRSRFESLGTP